MALKHRPDKTHSKRVILMIASPIEMEKSDFLKIAKEMKRDAIDITIINLGKFEKRLKMKKKRRRKKLRNFGKICRKHRGK